MHPSSATGDSASAGNARTSPRMGSFLFLQQVTQLFQRPMLGRLRGLGLRPGVPGILVARVLVLVAVDAEHFPIRAVGRVVVMVAVAVMHGELAQTLAVELSRAAGADPREDLQRLAAVIGLLRHPLIMRRKVNKSQPGLRARAHPARDAAEGKRGTGSGGA